MSAANQIDNMPPADEIKPPVIEVGVIGWIRTNLFNGWFNSLLTLATLFLLWKTVPPFIQWAFLNCSFYCQINCYPDLFVFSLWYQLGYF